MSPRARRKRCQAHGCGTTIRHYPGTFLCLRHWSKVPRRISATFGYGEVNQHVSVLAAIGALSVLEHGQVLPDEKTALLSFGYNEAALARGLLLNL